MQDMIGANSAFSAMPSTEKLVSMTMIEQNTLP